MHKTLVVEDNSAFRESLIGMLEGHFSTLVFEKAASSEEALLKLGRFSPELVFVDIGLPGQSGLILSKILRSRFEKAVIVVLTNHDGPEYRQEASRCGANFFISKCGSTVDEILEVVGRVVDGSLLHHCDEVAVPNQSARRLRPSDSETVGTYPRSSREARMSNQ